MEEAQRRVVTSRRLTISLHKENSELTGRAHPSFSTALCTSCATIGLERSILNKVGVASTCLFVLGSFECLCTSVIIHVQFVGKPGGYDRVRNAEIGNKVEHET